jgi:hypothetical protein
VAKCLPQLQTCPPNFNFPYYAFDAESSGTLKISSCWETDVKSGCGANDNVTGSGDYDIAIVDRSSGATIGCVQHGTASCPASFPEASYSSGALVGCKAARNCYSENAVEMVDAAGKVTDCWPLSDQQPCPEGYISVWSGSNTLARCIASLNAQGAAAICPSGYQFSLYRQLAAGSFAVLGCWIDGGIQDCASVLGSSPATGDYGVSLWNGTNQLQGCLAGNATGCPTDWQYPTHLVDGSLLSCSSQNVSKPVRCRNADDVELLSVNGTIVGCIAADADCPAAFSIIARDGGTSQRAACLAAGQSACPDSFPYPYYTPVAFSSVAITNCWRGASGVVASCNKLLDDGKYTVPVKSDASAGATNLGCVKQSTTACPGLALMISSGNEVLHCVQGLTDCSTTIDASGTKAIPVLDRGSLVGCGLGLCPDAFPVTVLEGQDLEFDPALGCMSQRSQCSEAPTGYRFSLVAGEELQLCIHTPADSGSVDCSGVTWFDGLELLDSSGSWVGCTTAETAQCPARFPQRTQDNSACQAAAEPAR